MDPWLWLAFAVIAAYALAVLALAIAGRGEAARALAGFVPDCAVLVARLAKDPATSRGDRILLVALAAYLASPLDLVPDFLPIAGQLDDAILVGLVLRRLIRRRGVDAVRAAWPGPESSLRAVLAASGARVPRATLQ